MELCSPNIGKTKRFFRGAKKTKTKKNRFFERNYFFLLKILKQNSDFIFFTFVNNSRHKTCFKFVSLNRRWVSIGPKGPIETQISY